MVDYIAASNGGIEMYADDADGKHVMVGWGNTPEAIAKVLDANGCYETVGCSSTVHFSGDYGFKHHDDADKLWGKGIELVHSIRQSRHVDGCQCGSCLQ
jgi:hypothetical protein